MPCCRTARSGELVFTSLTKIGMPVVRYRTRDLTRLLPGTARIDAADGEGHRPIGRHADRARGEHVPHRRSRNNCCKSDVLDRPLPDRADPRRPHGRGGGAVEAPPDFFDPGGAGGRSEGLVARIKDTIGLTTRVVVEAAGQHRTLIGQGEAGDGPALEGVGGPSTRIATWRALSRPASGLPVAAAAETSSPPVSASCSPSVS